MRRISFLIFFILLLSVSCLFSVETASESAEIIVSDSLKQSIEQRVEDEFGINENTTLATAAKTLKLDLNILKDQLGLDIKNSRLDKMKLSQLGISTYSVLLAQETIQYGFNESYTLLQIAQKFSIPVKKLKSLLGFDTLDASLNNRSLLSLDISLEGIAKANKEFDQSLFKIGSSIVLVGISVVFLALLLTAIIIGQLRHLNIDRDNKKPADLKISSTGKLVNKGKDIGNNEIIAVITTLHLYTHNLEERRRITMTYRRRNINLWHITGLTNMPNRLFNNKHA